MAEPRPDAARPLEDWLGAVHTADALEAMRAMPDKSFKAIVTSPPYNLSNTSGGGLFARPAHTSWPAGRLAEGYDGHDDAMPRDDYVAWQRECLAEMIRLRRDDGCVFYQHKWRVQRGVLEDCGPIVDGFGVRQIVIWQRAGGINHSPTFFLPTYEVIYVLAGPRMRLTTEGRAFGDIWTIPQVAGDPEHPATFPLTLPLRCICSLAGEPGPVLDPFIGSGTTAVAAVRLGMEWVGVEKSEQYAEVARRRIDEAERSAPLFVAGSSAWQQQGIEFA